MNEFWTTVLSTAGAAACASAIVSGVITSVASIWIQHIYDRKLEEHKAEVQKKIDEHQTQFNWWYEEKAKAIKEFYYSAVMWYQEMRDFRSISKGFATNIPVEIQNDLAKRLAQIIQMDNSSYKNWTFLRLYLKKEELLITDRFFPKGHSIFKDIGNQVEEMDFLLKGDKIDHDLTEMLLLVEELRQKMREILTIQEVKP